MKLNDIYTRLKQLNIPVAYRRFKEKPASIPFVLYYVDDENIYGSDYENLIRDSDINIELYTIDKSEEIERQIEELFHDFELNKTEIYIQSEDLIEILYSFTDIKKL